jgi:hypothetical protein
MLVRANKVKANDGIRVGGKMFIVSSVNIVFPDTENETVAVFARPIGTKHEQVFHMESGVLTEVVRDRKKREPVGKWA